MRFSLTLRWNFPLIITSGRKKPNLNPIGRLLKANKSHTQLQSQLIFPLFKITLIIYHRSMEIPSKELHNNRNKFKKNTSSACKFAWNFPIVYSLLFFLFAKLEKKLFFCINWDNIFHLLWNFLFELERREKNCNKILSLLGFSL